MNDRYRYKYGDIALGIIDNTRGVSPNVAGMDLLLEIAFWNIWKNSTEEIGAGCTITIVASVDREWVNLLITDNGPGFRDSQALEAFQISISTRGEERGRGLLEVADAIRRLRGVAQIISVNGEHRINISLPLAPKEMA
jgi:sensor histidine kinase regulating citrate/malate metabolism